MSEETRQDQSFEPAGGATTATAPEDTEAKDATASAEEEARQRSLDDVTDAERAALDDGAPESEVLDGSAQARAESTQRGFPVETTDGERVLIISKDSLPGIGEVMLDEAGNRYAPGPATAAGTRVQRLDEDGRLPREETPEADREEEEAA